MPDAVVYVATLLGCSLGAIGGAWLLGTRMWLLGVVTSQGRDSWPRGVQEQDAPHFAVAHADALRPSVPDAITFEDLDTEAGLPTPELVELHVRGYDRRH